MWCRAVAVLVAIAALGVSCGNESTERVQVFATEVALPPTDAPGPREPLADMDAFDEYVRQTPPLPADGGELVECKDVPELESGAEGSPGRAGMLGANVSDALNDYQLEHPDTYAGRWRHPVYRDVVVVVFTDGPEAHRQALQTRLSDLGDIIVDVVQAEFSYAQLRASAAYFHRQMRQEPSLDHSSSSVKQNRFVLGFVDPPDEVLEWLEEVAPTAALCLELTYPPEPPSGPLKVIPDPTVADPLVVCRGVPPVPFSAHVNPLPIDEVDHPAVDVLRIEIESPAVEPLPSGDWFVIKIDEDNAWFVAIDPDHGGTARFKRYGDAWGLATWGGGSRCNPMVPLPEGLRRVSVHLDPDALPNPEDTSIKLLVTESRCANGRAMGDALMGPQVVETDEAVLVAFAVIPVYGIVTCPGNPSTSVTIELSQPLGQRTLYDGLHVPPKPLTVDEDW